MVHRIGTLATKSCEPRQAWKGAAAAVESGAGMLLMRGATHYPQKVPCCRVVAGQYAHNKMIFLPANTCGASSGAALIASLTDGVMCRSSSGIKMQVAQ